MNKRHSDFVITNVVHPLQPDKGTAELQIQAQDNNIILNVQWNNSSPKEEQYVIPINEGKQRSLKIDVTHRC